MTNDMGHALIKHYQNTSVLIRYSLRTNLNNNNNNKQSSQYLHKTNGIHRKCDKEIKK